MQGQGGMRTSYRVQAEDGNESLFLCQCRASQFVRKLYCVFFLCWRSELCRVSRVHFYSWCMQLMEGDNFETPNTFYVKGKQKSLELHTMSVILHILWSVVV